MAHVTFWGYLLLTLAIHDQQDKRRGRLSYQSGAHGSGKEHRQFEAILARTLMGAMEMGRNAPTFPGVLGGDRGGSKVSDISA